MPGIAVGAGFAVTSGANEPTFFFSVGCTAGALLGAGVAGFSFSALQATKPPEATMAAAPATSARRWIKRVELILGVSSCQICTGHRTHNTLLQSK